MLEPAAGVARGWFARRPAMAWKLISDGNHPTHPMLRKYSRGTFRNFPRNHASMNAHARSVRKSLSDPQLSACFCGSFWDFPLSAQFPQDFPFCRVPHRCVQIIAAKVLENPLPLAGPQGRRVLGGPSALQKLVRQTVGEQMFTNRATENFPTGFRRGPLLGGPL